MHDFSTKTVGEPTRHHPPLRLRGRKGRYFCRLIAAIAACGAVTADAADIRRGFNDELVLEGTISPGDCSKVKNLLHAEEARQIYLASPGGNLAEAMEIGRLVRALKMETVVPGKSDLPLYGERAALRHKLNDYKTNYLCTSACFFVFVAGISRWADTPSGDPILGIHRPYLSENDLGGLSSDQAMAAANRTRLVVESYLKAMSVPAKYADQMFSVPKDKVQWISRDDYDADLDGVIPELRDWVDARGKALLDDIKKTKRENAMSTKEKAFLDDYEKTATDPITRKMQVISELSDDAWVQIFGKPGAAESFCPQRN